MTKSNGIKDLKQAAKLLNKHSPDGESLAYINPTEARILKAYGGSGIMTLSGVPSYDWWNPFSWDWTGEGGVIDKVTDIWQDKPVLDQAGKVILDSKGRQVIDKGRSIVGDALSVWGALRAKKDQEGLNAAEMEQFNKLNQQLATAETQFDVDTDFGAQLKAPTNVPETIEDVSVFKETTGIPDMKTTAVAEGGRIGFNAGGSHKAWLTSKGYKDMMKGMSTAEITALYDSVKGTWSKAQGGRIGYNMGGIGALNPRMGYRMGSPHGQEIPTFSEGVNQEFPSNELGVLDAQSNEGQSNLEWQQENLKKEKEIISLVQELMQSGNYEINEAMDIAKKMFQSVYQNEARAQGGRIGYGKGGSIAKLIGQGMDPSTALAMWEDWKDSGSQLSFQDYVGYGTTDNYAQGGRIGYQEGTHPLDGVAIEMFGMTFENLNPLQQIVVSQSQSKAQGGRIGYDTGGISTMMASASDPMDDKNQISYRLFGKGLHELTPDELIDLDEWMEDKAQKWQGAIGGRVAAQKGGIMPLLNMGGMEKDYRQEGGFVPIGRKEKADDVPARLSKNEFVFTADAVRAAGGGDIDQGAQRMYNVMKNLEAGGEISEQSQGQG